MKLLGENLETHAWHQGNLNPNHKCRGLCKGQWRVSCREPCVLQETGEKDRRVEKEGSCPDA